MCTNKLQIINPKLKAEHCTFNKYYDPLFLRVPCGKCQECQNMKQQEWLTRLSAEYEYTRSIGGFVWKDLFTYREGDVPTWHGLKCFNTEHYTNFAKKLRVYLNRDFQDKIEELEGKGMLPGFNKIDITVETIDRDSMQDDIIGYNNMNTDIYPDYNPKGKVKIFWVSEYGNHDGKGTKRPHYHAIFFVQYKCSIAKFKKAINKAWIYGFTSNKPYQENKINSMAGIGYAAKYLCKDIEFAKVLTEQKNSTFVEYLERQWQKLYNEPFDKEHFKKYPCDTVKKILKEIGMEEAIPYSRFSRYLGISVLQSLSQQEIDNGVMKQLKGTRMGKVYKVVPLPMYLQRKIYYDYNKCVKAWELNDKGRILKSLYEQKKIDRTINDLELIFNQPSDSAGGTEIGTEWVNGYEIRRPIDKSVTYKIYNDIKRNRNKYALLINLLTYRNTIVTESIIKEVEAGKNYQDIINDAIHNDWESARIYKEHKPHTQFLELYKRRELGNWENLITQATGDERFIELLKAFDKIKNTRLLNHERALIREHEAWVAVKNQPKRFKYK